MTAELIKQLMWSLPVPCNNLCHIKKKLVILKLWLAAVSGRVVGDTPKGGRGTLCSRFPELKLIFVRTGNMKHAEHKSAVTTHTNVSRALCNLLRLKIQLPLKKQKKEAILACKPGRFYYSSKCRALNGPDQWYWTYDMYVKGDML